MLLNLKGNKIERHKILVYAFVFSRSFSYGALPGVEEFQKRHNPLYTEDDDDYLATSGGGRGDSEDCDSGILVNGSITSSLCGGRGASFRGETTPTHCHGRSASQDQTHSAHLTVQGKPNLCNLYI